MMKIGILTTHPIQYQVPWFRALAREDEINLTVFFCMIPDAKQQGDGFGVPFTWDLPLLDGYQYRVLDNVSTAPAVTSFFGCDTPEITSVVRDEGFDAFIVNGWVAKSCLQLLLACRRYNVPCVVRGESNDIRPRTWWKRALHRQLLKRYSACLYLGEANRRFYLGNGVPDEKLFFAPYCVENERFKHAADAWRARHGQLRDEWGIPRDAVVFLFSGKFVAKKRPMDCLDGIRNASEELDSSEGTSSRPVHLLMVGTGALLHECQAAAARDDLPVTFAGFLNQGEIARAYAASDCLVLPSDDGETWGLVVNEAMACGLTAIVSDRVGCQKDLVTPGETGSVFPFGDTEQLGREIAGLCHDEEKLALLKRNAARRVEGYNYGRVVDGTLAAIRAVVSEPENGRVVA